MSHNFTSISTSEFDDDDDNGAMRTGKMTFVRGEWGRECHTGSRLDYFHVCNLLKYSIALSSAPFSPERPWCCE